LEDGEQDSGRGLSSYVRYDVDDSRRLLYILKKKEITHLHIALIQGIKAKCRRLKVASIDSHRQGVVERKAF